MKKLTTTIIIIVPLILAIFLVTKSKPQKDIVKETEVRGTEEAVDPLCNSLASNNPEGIEREVTCTFVLNGSLNINRQFEFVGHTIKISDPKTKELLQTIEVNEILGVGYGGPAFHIHDDINFDGYKDLWIRDGLGVLDNTPVTYWVYNPELQKFEMDKKLQTVSNPIFDATRKEITTSSRCCAGLSWGKETYSFIDGQYVITNKFYHDYDPADPNYATETEYKLVDGKMQVVSEKRVQIDTNRNNL